MHVLFFSLPIIGAYSHTFPRRSRRGILCAACNVVVGICCVTDTGGDKSVAEKATPSSPVVCVVLSLGLPLST